MKLWNHYYRPATVEEASDLLQRYAGSARIIAGGTDLLIDLRAAEAEPHEALIDITAIPDLCQIQEAEESISIGAGVTHAAIVKSPLLQAHAACLVESCGVVGGPQVRNVATLGGNVAHALPAGDGTTSLLALDAAAELIYEGQRQWRPIRELFLGVGQSLLDSSRDLLLGFRLPKMRAGEGSAFSRIMRPQGVALPILGCAVWLRVEADHIADARICIAPVAPTPQRISAVEEALRGQPASDASIQAAAALAMEVLDPRTSKYRASADYRREMARVLLQRTLPAALDRARQHSVLIGA